jgi:predicted alpha/beta-hydrolase family hydrolase
MSHASIAAKAPVQLEIDTPYGRARAHVTKVRGARAALILGHGAGGGIGASDLVAAREAALARQISVALVEQPYRVAGRRAPAPAHQLDAVWTAVVSDLLRDPFRRLEVIVGGRSMGARVACRTAPPAGAMGVVCLAFPLRPPRREGKPQAESRLPELAAVTVPLLVVQGDRDPFGIPPPASNRTVVTVRGDHSLRSDRDAVRQAVSDWLEELLDD